MEIGPSTIIGVALVTIGILLYALKEREPSVSRGVIFYRYFKYYYFQHILSIIYMKLE